MDKKYIALNSLVGFDKVADGYFWNTEDNNLYSNKQSNHLVRLLGSSVRGIRRYTLQRQPKFKYWDNHTFSARQDHIKDVANSKQLSETKLKRPEGLVLVASGIPTKGWIIGIIKDGSFTLAAFPKVHKDEKLVDVEIERLAKLTPGKIYVKLKVDAYVQSGGVNWF